MKFLDVFKLLPLLMKSAMNLEQHTSADYDTIATLLQNCRIHLVNCSIIVGLRSQLMAVLQHPKTWYKCRERDKFTLIKEGFCALI